MASTIPAFLLYAGRTLTLGNISSLTEIWMSSNIRPDLAITYLPVLGDNPSAANIISDQSVLNTTDTVSGSLGSLHCKSITEQEYIESSTVRGTIYQVNYDDEVIGGTTDPTADGESVVLNIASGSQVETYYPKKGSTWYLTTPDGETIEDYAITKVSGVTNVSTTMRYRGKTAEEIIAMGQETGKINNEEMWGVGLGNILFTGVQSVPIQEYNKLTSTKSLNWNVTNNYQIKYLPGVAIDTWQYIWYHGAWIRAQEGMGGGDYSPYESGTIPNDLA